MDWSTIILSVLSAALVAFVTAIFTYRQFERGNDKEDIKRAVDLSAYYAENIIPYTNYITYVHKNWNARPKEKEILNERRQDGELEFTFKEMEELFGKDNVDAIIEEFSFSNVPVDVLITARLLNLELNLPQTFLERNVIIDSKEGRKTSNIEIDRDFQLRKEYSTIKLEILNRLEYFAMNFSTEIADESIVYQSLHQTYISTMQNLYFDIANHNKDLKDMFYVNAIHLFNLWNERYMTKKANEIMAREEIKMQESIINSSTTLVEKPKSYKK